MKKIFLILLTAVILLSVCSCKNEKTPDTADDTDPVVSDTVDLEISDDTTQDVSEFYVSDAEVYEIETPYGPIYYPTKWKDIAVTEISEDSASYRVKFSAQLDGKSVPLYTIAFGASEEGYIAAGTLMIGEDETIRVYYEDHSAEGMKAGLTGASEETYLTMCEDINVIMSNLVYVSGMELD